MWVGVFCDVFGCDVCDGVVVFVVGFICVVGVAAVGFCVCWCGYGVYDVDAFLVGF